MRAAVIGGGSWGTALASVLGDNGHDVTIWSFEEDVARAISERHALPNSDARDTNVVRGFIGQSDRSACNERLSGEKSRYRGAICTLHQMASVSSRSIPQPPSRSTGTTPEMKSRSPARTASV